MKLTIAPRPFAETVAWAARTLPARPGVPVLAGLLLEVGDELAVSAFDYDTSARATVAADTVSEPGKILLPGRLLAEILKSLAKRRDMVDLAATEAECTIRCGSAEFTLQTLPVDDYPKLPQAPDTVGSIDADALALAVAQVYPAAGRDDTLPMLTGIRVETDGDKLTLATTDRYRIGVHTTTWQPNSGPLALMVPGRTLNDVARGLATGTVTVGATDQTIAFTNGTRVTTVRLLDDQFPKYRTIIDKLEPSITACFDPMTLAAAIKEVQVVAERNSGVRLAFTNDHVRVQAGTSDSGRGTETVPCNLTGDDIEIAFQAQYLLDGLTAATSSEVTLAMATPAKPALLKDGALEYLAMSLRVS